MAAFADVLLRGLALGGQAVVIGGVVFAFIALAAPSGSMERATLERRMGRVWALIAVGGAAVVIVQSLSIAILLSALGFGPAPRELLETTYVRAALARTVASAGAVVGAVALRRRPARWSWILVTVSALLVGLSAAWTSHAAARLQHRAVLLTLDALHQLAAAAWVGSLLHLAAAAFSDRRAWWPVGLLRRFSLVALVTVGVLVGGGIGLAVGYVDGLAGLVGTAHGVMILTKIVVLAGLLGLGAANFFAVRRFTHAPGTSLVRLRRFVEVEFGLGMTVLFAAASLTSLPPARDVVADRATPREVAMRFVPRWPRLTSPPITELPVGDRNAPRTDADRAWSEYNHHVSGLFVLGMGLLASLHVSGAARWARHWPLVLLGLGAFMFVRNDPGAWPLGPQGFWASLAEPTVLQHRAFVLLVVGFGIFEWMVRTGRLRSPRYALVFPLLCAAGSALLLTHSHASLNLKSEFLLEVTHAPLAVLGLCVGWARWLELRLARPDDRVPARVWSLAMTAVGVLLLLYRES